MLAYTYVDKGIFELQRKEKPHIIAPRDAVVRVTLASICTSDLHIKHGFVPRAVQGITVGHEMVGVVEEVGSEVQNVAAGDRVAVNVETFCGDCFFCKNGYVNNCTDPKGGWAMGCRIDGGQAEYARVPFADNCLSRLPLGVSDRQALFVGDILATGYWAADISEIEEGEEVLVLGGGPTGICCALCAELKGARVSVSEKDEKRRAFIAENYPFLRALSPEEAESLFPRLARGGADRVIEAAGGEDTFEQAWRLARPNAVVTIVAMYESDRILPLPRMYGKNLVFKTGGVDGSKCDEIISLIAAGRLNTLPLITHTFAFEEIERAYELFAAHSDGVMKVAVTYEQFRH